MEFKELQELDSIEKMPGYHGKFVHSANLTFVYWDILEGSPLPEHSHPHEQVANVLEGEFELTVSGETIILKAGTVAVIPSNALHSGKALTKCRILDVF